MAANSSQSLVTRMRETAARMGGAALVLTADGEISFAEIDRRSDRIAAALAARGIARGDRVALYCPNSAEFVAIYTGILKAGATVVPVNLLLNPKEIAFVLDDAGVKALFFHPLFTAAVAQFAPQVASLRLQVVIGSEGDGETLAGMMVGDAAPPEVALDPDRDLAVVLYTSGTTGRPKGAMLSHANLLANSYSVVAGLKLREGQDRLLVVLPMFHAFAATVGMLTPLLHGMTIVPVPRFDPQLVTDAIEATRATLFLGVPSMYSLFLKVADDHAPRWASIRYCVSGGAAMPVAVMQAFEQRFGKPVLEGDGPTECGPVTCVNPIDGARKPGSVGLPVPQVEMCVLDDGGAPLPDGEIGEVCVRGPNVMRGYLGLPQESAESFHGAWFRTGDLGYRDADGYFFLVDRKKDMLIVNGMNVYPRIIEETLYRHPAVAEAAVIGEPHELHGEIVVACVVLKEGAGVNATEIRAWCREHLGQHEIPRRVEFMQALPKNAAGKILKRELRRQGELERGIDSRERR